MWIEKYETLRHPALSYRSLHTPKKGHENIELQALIENHLNNQLHFDISGVFYTVDLRVIAKNGGILESLRCEHWRGIADGYS